MDQDNRKRAGRPPKGHVFYEGGRWKVRITCTNGERGTLPLDPTFPPHDALARGAKDDTSKCGCRGCSLARAQGAEFTREARATDWRPPREGKSVAQPIATFGEWWKDYAKVRERKIAAETWRKEQSHHTKWIGPALDKVRARGIDRRDLERFVEMLDESVEAEDISAKSASNIWGTVTKAFDEMCRSKTLALRVRDDNPTAAVRGPDEGVKRAAPYLWPSEMVKLCEAPRVPLARKRLYALASFTGLRAGELAALTWGDVHLDAGYIQVHRTINSDGEIAPTKTKETRRVAIESNLRPLLVAMLGEDGEPVIVMPHRSELADLLRADLAEAGVKRAELFADDETRRRLVFHDLRRTHGTWKAIRGDDAFKIQRSLGHSQMTMTQVYIADADNFDVGAGVPFPPLPPAILPGNFAGSTVRHARSGEKTERPQGDSNPR